MNSKKSNCSSKLVRGKSSSGIVKFPDQGMVSIASDLRNAGKNGVALRLLESFIAQRKHADPSESYTAFLSSVGIEEAVRILVDEAVQLALKATTNSKNSELLVESADLFFNILVLLDSRGISFSEIIDEVVERVIESGCNVKSFKKLKEGSLTEGDLAEYILSNSSSTRRSIPKASLISSVSSASNFKNTKKLKTSKKAKVVKSAKKLEKAGKAKVAKVAKSAKKLEKSGKAKVAKVVKSAKKLEKAGKAKVAKVAKSAKKLEKSGKAKVAKVVKKLEKAGKAKVAKVIKKGKKLKVSKLSTSLKKNINRAA